MSSIFLSHNRKDKSFARQLGASLRRYGAKVWIDEAEIKVGESLIKKIEQAIKEMDYLGVILSPDSVESEWVKREVEIALTDEIGGKHVKVLPILARRCEIPGFLSGKLYADFRRKRDWDNALISVVRALGLDENSSDRVSGSRVILLEDFLAKIEEYFGVRKTEVEFYEDWSGIDYIKVQNDDKTFELYTYDTRPSHIDLINKLFRNEGSPHIENVELKESFIISERERSQKHDEIKAKYNLPKDSYSGQWNDRASEDENCKKAWAEWDTWWNGKQCVFLIPKM